MKKIIPLLLAIFIVLVGCSQSNGDKQQADSHKLKVVTTNSILYDMVKMSVAIMLTSIALFLLDKIHMNMKSNLRILKVNRCRCYIL